MATGSVTLWASAGANGSLAKQGASAIAMTFDATEASMVLYLRFGNLGIQFDSDLAGSLSLDAMETYAPLSIVMRGDLEPEMHLTIRRKWVTSPGTGKPEYRVIVKDVFGTSYGELEKSALDRVPVGSLNATETFGFTMARNDPKTKHIIPSLREVEVWRGGQIVSAGVVVDKDSSEGNMTTFTCNTLDWYMRRRVIGLVPTPNLLKNGSFEEGLRHWSFTYAPNSIPAAPPKHKIVNETINGERALHIEGVTSVMVNKSVIGSDANFASGSYSLTNSGRAAVKRVISKVQPGPFTMYIEGHTDSVPHPAPGGNDTLSLNRAQAVRNYAYSLRPDGNYVVTGKGQWEPIATNTTAAGRALNRRVEMSYTQVVEAKGHRQYGYQRFKITQPTQAKKKLPLTLVGWCKITEYDEPSKDGWGVYMHAKNTNTGKIVATAYVAINKETPKNRWTRMECSLLVPANGVEHEIEVRLYPPAGVCIWDEIGVTAAHQLGFFDKDQATIFKELVEHLQDPAMGKSDVRLTPRVTPTSRKRTREYPFSERLEGWEALYEWPTLADGMDVTIELTETDRYIVTHYPRKVRNIREPLVLGKNIMGYGVQEDGSEVSTTIIVQAEGEGSDREEGVVQNTSKTNGLVLEKVYNATPGSAISSLQKQAERGYKRYGKPIVVTEVVLMPHLTSWALDTFELGDIVSTVIKDDFLDVDIKNRIVGMYLDPVNDALSLVVNPED